MHARQLRRNVFTTMNTTYQSPNPGADVGDRVEAGKQAVKDRVEDAKAQAQEVASKTSADVKAGAQQAAAEAGGYLEKVVREQKGTLADTVDEYRDAARAAVDKLTDEEHSVAAQKIDRAADQLDRVSTFLRDTQPQDLLAEAGHLARRRPEYVFGGLFLAGLGLARFLKASERTRRSERSNGMRREPARGFSGGSDYSPPVAGSKPSLSATPTTGGTSSYLSPTAATGGPSV